MRDRGVLTVKNNAFLLLSAVIVFTGCQSTQAPAAQTSKFRTCNGFDGGPFQIPASQKCPLSGYAQAPGVPIVIEGKPKAATPPRNSYFRTCNGVDGAFQVPISQKCPLSGYSHY